MSALATRPGLWSIAGVLRRSGRAVYVVLGAALLVGAITTFTFVGVFHPRLNRLDGAAVGLQAGQIGIQDERAALLRYLLTLRPADLDAYHQAQKEVSNADAVLVRSGLGGRDVLDKLVAVSTAEQAWLTGWASQVPRVASSLTGTRPSAQLSQFLDQGNTLFAAYTHASQAALADLSSRRHDTSNEEWAVATAGFFTAAALIVAAGFLVVDQRRLTLRNLSRSVGPLISAARQIEAGEKPGLGLINVPSELDELARVVLGMARELDGLREAVEMTTSQAELRATKLMQVLELTRAIGGNLSLRPVMDAVASAARQVSGAQRVVLWISDEEGLRLSADTGGAQYENGFEASEPVVQAATYGRTTRTQVGVGGGDLRRLAIPMTFGGRVVGVIELRGDELANLESEDVELIETLASNGASAIEAARAHGVTESLSMTDALTRLPNRRQLEHDLATECERARRYGRSSALIMLDVDGFKAFNDRYGHQAGDQVLAQFGQLLADSIRASDSAYRYGGEEFAVLVREASVTAAADLAERLRQQVAERFSVLPQDAPVTASFGVVGVDQVDPEPATLVGAADEALYAAKEGGRNRVECFQ